MILTLLILLTLNPASDSTAWHLWEKADSLYRNERFGEAVSTAAEADALFRKDGDKEGQAEALSTEATAWFSLGASPSVHLSSRELEVARFCCDGLTAKEIAQRLQISVRTVETHKNNIFRKLGITTTVDLVRLMGKIQ